MYLYYILLDVLVRSKKTFKIPELFIGRDPTLFLTGTKYMNRKFTIKYKYVDKNLKIIYG